MLTKPLVLTVTKKRAAEVEGRAEGDARAAFFEIQVSEQKVERRTDGEVSPAARAGGKFQKERNLKHVLGVGTAKNLSESFVIVALPVARLLDLNLHPPTPRQAHGNVKYAGVLYQIAGSVLLAQLLGDAGRGGRLTSAVS